MAENETTPKQKNWFARHKVWTAIIAFIVLVMIMNGGKGGNSSNTSSKTASSSSSQSSAPKATPTPVRQVAGKATTLGAGTFTGGQDVVAGLYDVTPGAGQSGNFMVDGSDSYNEILGTAGGADGVPKVRAKISSGDKITISSLSQVVFTPVTAPFVTSHSAATLYAGKFTVGEDVGAGKYVVTPGAGQSGNFMVDGSTSVNEILGGDSSMGGVPNVTVTLSDGDSITISSLSQVNFTPSS